MTAEPRRALSGPRRGGVQAPCRKRERARGRAVRILRGPLFRLSYFAPRRAKSGWRARPCSCPESISRRIRRRPKGSWNRLRNRIIRDRKTSFHRPCRRLWKIGFLSLSPIWRPRSALSDLFPLQSVYLFTKGRFLANLRQTFAPSRNRTAQSAGFGGLFPLRTFLNLLFF